MRPIDIVVPVHNGADDLPRCLASLVRHRPENSRIVLVDDASTDPRIAPMLTEFTHGQPDVLQVSQHPNRGFIATCNRGAAEARADADLLFLNTDTEVTEGWAREMAEALESQAGAAVACPLSNNATILSVPRFQQENTLPFGMDAERMAGIVRSCAGGMRAVRIPTPVGFCMLVKRDAWQRWGPFDEAFGRGYGEEDDFGQRVQAAGSAIVCAPRAFVYHRGAASFGVSPELAQQRRANGELLLSRWPNYNDRTKAWCRQNPLRTLHEMIWRALLLPPGESAHVLHVLDRWETSGDVRQRMVNLVNATVGFAMHTIVVPMQDKGAWLDVMDFEYARGVRVAGLLDFETRFAQFVQAAAPTVVHIHGTDWIPQELVDPLRDLYPVLTTPPEAANDTARCAEQYRRALAGR